MAIAISNFFPQRRLTVVLVTLDTIARVDCRGSTNVDVVDAWRTERSGQTDFPQAVQQALRLGPKQNGSLVLLTDELWAGSVSLERHVVDAIDEEQLDQAISLEIEYESGIPAFESQLGRCETSSDDTHTAWQVVQMETAQLDALKDALAPWSRHTITIGHLVAAANQTTNAASPRTRDACAQAARDWVQARQAGQPQAPAIVITPVRWLPLRHPLVRAIPAACTFVLCLLHYWHTTSLVQEAESTRTVLLQQHQTLRTKQQHLAAERRQLTTEEQAQTQARERQTQQVANYHRWQFAQQADRERPLDLLRSLATTASDTHCIAQVYVSKTDSLISGVALDRHSFRHFTEQLEQALAPHWWTMEPASWTVDDTGIVRFAIRLSPSRSTGDSAPASNAVPPGADHVL